MLAVNLFKTSLKKMSESTALVYFAGDEEEKCDNIGQNSADGGQTTTASGTSVSQSNTTYTVSTEYGNLL
jgi:hypothetical protein